MKKFKNSKDTFAFVAEAACQLCKRCDNCPDKYGEKVTLKQHALTVHYFCLLMSSGIYQRGEEDEGVYGFLVEDIQKEIRRSSRLKCCGCRKSGASVGCSVKSCRKMVHMPCGLEMRFIFQFSGLFPSFCAEHQPTQTVSVSPSPPLTCSVCLDPIQPVLSFSVLKCPACYSSWFHRDCVQAQAHSAARFFFKCTICNNQEQFQEEMIRMGVYIPERDASWELEENAYEDLLQVYQHCDAVVCQSHRGRKHSAQSGNFQIIRCVLCGSHGTHRKCSSLNVAENNWVCWDCKSAVEQSRRMVQCQEKRLLGKRLSSLRSELELKRRTKLCSASEFLQLLSAEIYSRPPSGVEVDVGDGDVLEAGLALLRRLDFNPELPFSVRFSNNRQNCGSSAVNLRRFFRLLVPRLQASSVFEGPSGAKDLALDSQGLRQDLYFEAGCLLALSLVHGGPPPTFFSKALFYCLFNFPKEYQLGLCDITEATFAQKLKKIREAKNMKGLKQAMAAASEYLDLAGCRREVSSLCEKYAVIEDIVNFHLIVRMQLPLQRFCEGLRTLGLYDIIQANPLPFYHLFCVPPNPLTAEGVAAMFSLHHSEQEDQRAAEELTVRHWQQFLQECEDGRCATSLEDVLLFATNADMVPAAGFVPSPTITFLHLVDSIVSFPQSQPDCNRLLLPVIASYPKFKKDMEYAVCQLILLQDL
ncbi:G2/M phase-specific E3 ubiquitin-protein ligase [Denticeps clupeoides]|uniref:G2/M phase-specific E3 ubiquitin-protein ligase n=1 Tax=Denticeps clupeoides TaxID=299321 RepID=UPI0010A2E433|nr:G2/M phase-specific E3 ubiquitin-protein ligase [Denticeps clupeoides]